jgi:hypothetical protein
MPGTLYRWTPRQDDCSQPSLLPPPAAGHPGQARIVTFRPSPRRSRNGLRVGMAALRRLKLASRCPDPLRRDVDRLPKVIPEACWPGRWRGLPRDAGSPLPWTAEAHGRSRPGRSSRKPVPCRSDRLALAVRPAENAGRTFCPFGASADGRLLGEAPENPRGDLGRRRIRAFTAGIGPDASGTRDFSTAPPVRARARLKASRPAPSEARPQRPMSCAPCGSPCRITSAEPATRAAGRRVPPTGAPERARHGSRRRRDSAPIMTVADASCA